MFTILELAEHARVSKEKARYWLKLLELTPTKQEGKLYYSAGSDELLAAMKNLVDSGMPPVAAATEAKLISPTPAASAELPAPICNQDSQKIADLEKAVLLMAQTIEKQSKMIEQQTAALAAQSVKIEALSAKLLPPPPAEVKPVNVWQPAARKPPQVSWFMRAWLELINPEKLRAMP